MNADLQYGALCHATRIRALGQWLRASLPVVFFDAPADDFEFGNNPDHWAELAGCRIERCTTAATHGHYRLTMHVHGLESGRDEWYLLSHFYWQFVPQS